MKKLSLKIVTWVGVFWMGMVLEVTLGQQFSDGNFFQKLKAETAKKSEDTCFCQLQGAIDDCSCQIDTVDKFNNEKIFPRLKSLLYKDYFRYFEINLKKPCPFWSDDGACALESCQVKACKEDEVPIGLKGQNEKLLQAKVSKSRKFYAQVAYQSVPAEIIRIHKKKCISNFQKNDDKDCSGNVDLGSINETISENTQAGFERWKSHDENLVDFCTLKDEVDVDAQYVDLLLNPERYTGYKGPSAHRIWSSIYNENCFKTSMTTMIMEPFASDLNKSNETCIEKRTFYRAISGLHASINIHLSAKYLLSSSKLDAMFNSKSDGKWGPNLTEFRSHFDKLEAQKEGFSWLKNLYFLYLLELRAVVKAAPFLRNFNFYTGNAEEDSDVKLAIKDLLRVVDSFPSHFQETALFSTKDAPKLKAEFHQRFTNITRIMDCVGCQKCRLWGTIQIKGLGTALKVLFSEPSNFGRGVDFLTRNEVVSLINAFGRLSESIHELENFRKLMDEDAGGGGGISFR